MVEALSTGLTAVSSAHTNTPDRVAEYYPIGGHPVSEDNELVFTS